MERDDGPDGTPPGARGGHRPRARVGALLETARRDAAKRRSSIEDEKPFGIEGFLVPSRAGARDPRRRRRPRARSTTRRAPRRSGGRPPSTACPAAPRRPARGRRRGGYRRAHPRCAVRRDLPRRLALDCSTGRRTSASGGQVTGATAPAGRASRGPGRTRAGSAPAGFGRSTVSAPGSSALESGPRALAQLGQRLQRQFAVEEHHRRGLVRPAALQPVQTVDRLGRVGRARQPVDGVGREQRNAVRAHAPLEGRDVVRRHAGRPRRAGCRRGRPVPR